MQETLIELVVDMIVYITFFDSQLQIYLLALNALTLIRKHRVRDIFEVYR